MNFKKAMVMAVSLILAVGLLASYAQAQSDPPRGDGARLSADEMRERQLQELAERVAALKREIEATQRQAAGGPQDRIVEQLRQRRMAEVAAGQAAKPGAPKPEADGLRVIINGQEVKVGDGKVVVLEDSKADPLSPKSYQVIVREDGKPTAPKGREEQERIEQAERAMKPNPAPQRGKPEGGKEGEEGVKFIIRGMELKVGQDGKVGDGKFVVVPEGRPGQPAPGSMKPLPPGSSWQAVPGGVKLPPPGSPWQAAAGANPARAGAPAGQPGGVIVFREGQEREGREAEEREARERREGGGLRLNPAPPPGGGPYGAPGLRGPERGQPNPGPTGWGQPMPGAPAPGQPFRPNVAAAQMQEFQRMMGMLNVFKEVSFNPESAAMIAIGGIKDENPRRPEAAIRVLESTLKKTRTVGLRTAIHMALKDLYKAQGNEEMVLEHLRATLLENDEAIQEHQAPMMKRGGEKDGPSSKGKDGKKDKDEDDDD